jgi:hypothetical protein
VADNMNVSPDSASSRVVPITSAIAWVGVVEGHSQSPYDDEHAVGSTS